MPATPSAPALIAAANSYMGRVVVVVDEDIDPSNLADVMWAVTTRCEPSEQIDIVRNAWSSALDPRIPAEDKLRGVTSHSKVIIEACGRSPGSTNFRSLRAVARGRQRHRGKMARRAKRQNISAEKTSSDCATNRRLFVARGRLDDQFDRLVQLGLVVRKYRCRCWRFWRSSRPVRRPEG